MQRVDLPKRLWARYLELPRELRDLPVYLAVSGGLDSTVLAAVALRLRARLPALHFAHVNYRLRLPDSDREEAWLRDWARREGLPIHVLSLATEAKPANLQAWARERRLAFFRKLTRHGGIVWIAHHRDDQAETVLTRLLRGAGLKGLRGMQRLEEIEGLWLFRPFLEVPREAIQIYAQAHGLVHQHDRSNDGDDYLRNRLRHRVLPLLREENPRILEVLEEFGTRAGEAAQALQELANTWLRRAARGGGVAPAILKVRALRRQPAALRAAVLESWLRLRTGRDQSFGKILPPALAALEDPARRLDLPLKGGYRLLRTQAGLALRRLGGRAAGWRRPGRGARARKKPSKS